MDLTLEDTTINQTNKNSAGLDVRQGSDVDLTLKGDNTIDGSQATGDKNVSDNTNVEGIRVGGEVASDSSDAEKRRSPDHQGRHFQQGRSRCRGHHRGQARLPVIPPRTTRPPAAA